jgi:hypothetical protein
MRLPGLIKIHATGEGNLAGIIFIIRVTAGTKNKYSIAFPKTDTSGTALLSEDEFRGQFEDHLEAGLMDYNGTVESADPTVTVCLLDKSRIESNLDLLRAWPLLKNDKKRWRSREEKIQYWLTCRNDLFDISGKYRDTIPINS